MVSAEEQAVLRPRPRWWLVFGEEGDPLYGALHPAGQGGKLGGDNRGELVGG